MKWPSAPKCHPKEKATWCQPEPFHEPYGRPYRFCSFCGTIHPEDMLRLLEQGHRFTREVVQPPHTLVCLHIDTIPNPLAGRQVRLSGRMTVRGGKPVNEPIMGPAPELCSARWSVSHMLDEYDDEAFSLVQHSILKQTGQFFLASHGRLSVLSEVEYAPDLLELT